MAFLKSRKKGKELIEIGFKVDASLLKPVSYRAKNFEVFEENVFNINGVDLVIAEVGWQSRGCLYSTTALKLGDKHYCIWKNKKVLFDILPAEVIRFYFEKGLDVHYGAY